jgi:hypothetical protein
MQVPNATGLLKTEAKTFHGDLFLSQLHLLFELTY